MGKMKIMLIIQATNNFEIVSWRPRFFPHNWKLWDEYSQAVTCDSWKKNNEMEKIQKCFRYPFLFSDNCSQYDAITVQLSVWNLDFSYFIGHFYFKDNIFI